MRVGLWAVPLLMLAGCGGGTAEENVAANAVVEKPKPPVRMLGDYDLNQRTHAFGTEPGWSLDMGPGEMLFTDFAMEVPEPKPFYWVDPVIAGDTATYTTKNVPGDVVVLTLTRKDCLEVGEADQTVPLTATLRIGSRTLKGCAGLKPVEAEVPDEEMDNVIDNAAMP